MPHRITLLPGDGIGPEVVEATVRVLEATGVAFEWDRFEEVGAAAMEAFGTPLPEPVLDSIRANKVALKGPITTPIGEGFRSVNVSLRQKLDLFANVRPCSTMPGIETHFDHVDLIIFRENTEGLYSGIETFDERLQIADSIARITRAGSNRIIRYCFDYARRHGRKQVTLVHKANILKKSTGMFLAVGREMAEEYPDLDFNDRIIDNMAMQLVMYPEHYDCIVTTNLFGDILSDEASVLAGSMGLLPSASLSGVPMPGRLTRGFYEPIHGTAPDIAGRRGLE
ncbi:MAG: isocitrate/isopropylmalate dehydrogenase family protein [SAR324 cluster bacterium]|nr:isocitrate/isopropylmalate dehydrogenase family protein [SAR324 cluster bacterium]